MMASRTTGANLTDNQYTATSLSEAESEPPYSRVTSGPVRLALSVGSNTFHAFQPFAPQVIPVVFCLLLIPLALLLAAFSGFVVWRSVAVGWELPLHLQFGDGVPPYALAPLPQIIPQQHYDISLQLTVPATDSNYALGNFMTTLTLSTPSNKTLISVRRPAIVFPPQTSFFSRKPSVSSITVPMLLSYVMGSSKVIASVEIGRRDRWTSLGNGEGRELSVVSASVRGLVAHHGVRGVVARFPLTSAFISALIFFVIILSILAACILPAIVQRGDGDNVGSPRSEISTKELPRPSFSPSGSSADAELPLRRRRPRVNRSRNTKTRVKTEAPIGVIPSANVKSGTLRQRSSRPSDGFSDSES